VRSERGRTIERSETEQQYEQPAGSDENVVGCDRLFEERNGRRREQQDPRSSCEAAWKCFPHVRRVPTRNWTPSPERNERSATETNKRRSRYASADDGSNKTYNAPAAMSVDSPIPKDQYRHHRGIDRR